MFFGKKKVVRSSMESGVVRKITRLGKNVLNESSIVELNNILKDYLRSKFKINQSLTLEETLHKLEEKKLKKASKIDLYHLLTQINQKEYNPQGEITAQEVSFLLKLAIKTLQEIESGKGLVEKEVTIPKGKVLEVKKSKELLKLESDILSLGKNFSIDWRNPSVRKVYDTIRGDYAKLSNDEKRLFYPKIISLFKLKKG